MQPLQAELASLGTVQSSWWVVTVMLHDMNIAATFVVSDAP